MEQLSFRFVFSILYTYQTSSKNTNRILQVRASDIDSGRYGTLRYTQLHGVYANAFVLDPISGLITVGSGLLLDREASAG